MVSGRWNSKLLVVCSTCHQGGSRFTMLFVVWNILDLNLEFEIDTKFHNDIMRSEIKMVGSHGWFTWFFSPNHTKPIPNWKLRCGPVQQAFYTFLCCSCLQMRRPQSSPSPYPKLSACCTQKGHRSRLRPRLRQQQQEFVDLLIYGAILLRSPMVHSPLLSTNMNKT